VCPKTCPTAPGLSASAARFRVSLVDSRRCGAAYEMTRSR
jgi:hypothetical protein